MDEVENVNITETPRITINASSRNSHDSVDSGYLTLLSPPPSPSVPSSSFIASEPIEEDVEMKLVIVPQSTPQVTTSPRRKTPPPPPRIVISPTCRKASPAISSADNQKLSKLSITYLAAIKPKRLDFSHRVISAALHHSRATPDYTGRETVDILALLGDKSNHWRIVSKILSFLGPQDLCSISMVSKTWRRICFSDSRANVRRLTHIILRQNAKENLKLIKKSKIEGDIQSSPRSRYARKGYLLEVQNLLQVQGNKRPPSSPPVSPSKVKFHSFVKICSTLKNYPLAMDDLLGTLVVPSLLGNICYRVQNVRFLVTWTVRRT
ncbi:uncharacterized protein LOC102673123 isoform X2 [Apis dorsata]|uniref:uncharacterized protein LOC102673123 isoform X2 n=1 Tax=Apis dorsata TaxID=7462 RepID=UPI0003DF52FB|nr:uncharacterized protein LOC102673123 isoform X2 [Apis dorsata]